MGCPAGTPFSSDSPRRHAQRVRSSVCRAPTDRGTVTETGRLRRGELVPPEARADPRAALLLASSGFFLITLDILIVNVALTRIDRELGGGTVGQQWVIDGYTLMFASLLLFAGNLSDRIGAKRAFGSGSRCSGWHRSPARGADDRRAHRGPVGQGAAAAVMLPASMALISEGVPRSPPPGESAGGLGRRGCGRRCCRTAARRNTDRAGLAVGVRRQSPGLRGDARSAESGSRRRRPARPRSTGPGRSSA